MSGHDREVLDFLRFRFDRVDSKLDRVIEDVADLKQRMSSLDGKVALLHGDFAARGCSWAFKGLTDGR